MEINHFEILLCRANPNITEIRIAIEYVYFIHLQKKNDNLLAWHLHTPYMFIFALAKCVVFCLYRVWRNSDPVTVTNNNNKSPNFCRTLYVQLWLHVHSSSFTPKANMEHTHTHTQTFDASLKIARDRKMFGTFLFVKNAERVRACNNKKHDIERTHTHNRFTARLR